jgi:hypothetical protein
MKSLGVSATSATWSAFFGNRSARRGEIARIWAFATRKSTPSLTSPMTEPFRRPGRESARAIQRPSSLPPAQLTANSNLSGITPTMEY